MTRSAITRLVVGTVAAFALVLAGAASAPAAVAAPSSSSAWGWDQLKLKTLNSAQKAVLLDALISAQPAAKTDARRQALALLVTSGAVTPSQADLLAAVNTQSAINALIAKGDFTKQRGAAVSQVIKGYSRTQARYSAAKFALELLTSTGVLNHEQAEEVRAQLVNIR
jgi:hypothetical protein